MRRKISDTTKVISAFMSKEHTNCLTLDELQYLTNINRKKLIRILHELYKEGLIHRHWRHYTNRKEREYCLKKEKILEKLK